MFRGEKQEMKFLLFILKINGNNGKDGISRFHTSNIGHSLSEHRMKFIKSPANFSAFYFHSMRQPHERAGWLLWLHLYPVRIKPTTH